ncbi:hypothetical protein LJ721_004718 [Salmonella enterica]|nr:hypothetical protein [Salmonella enterica]
MTILTVDEVQTADSKELVTFFNRYANAIDAKTVNRFSSRAVAVRRCTELAAVLANQEEENDAGTKEEAASLPAAPEVVTEKDCTEEAKRILGAREKQRAGITASWGDEKVKAARMTKNKVICGGVEYGSFRQAWAAAGFPDSIHIRNRMKLKKEGVLVYEGVKFKLGSRY